MQGIKFKSNKQQFDLKKSLSKLFDYKRDCFSRLRALKSICDAKDIREVKETFMSNYSVIYSVFHETFVILDSVKFNGHRKNATEDDRLLFYVFEKILLLLPEKLEKRWQMNSLIFIFRKCLHPTNLLSIRLEAMRLFLIYYQILGEINVRQNQQIEFLYASLIPGVVLNDTISSANQHLAESPLIDPNQFKYFGIRPFPIEPFILNVDQSLSSLHSNSSSATAASSSSSSTHGSTTVSNNYPNYEFKQYTKIFFTQYLLDYSLSQCVKIYWRDHRERRHLRGFEFLFSSFSRIYLPYLFPMLAIKNPNENEWNDFTIRLLISIYYQTNELPKLRRYRDYYSSQNEHLPYLQAVVVQWLAKYLLSSNRDNVNHPTLTPTNTDPSSSSSLASNLSKFSNSQTNLLHSSYSFTSIMSSSHSSSMSMFNQLSKQTLLMNNQQTMINSPTFEYESDLFRLLLNSRRFYVDLVLNLFHQSFLWPFHEDLTITMRDVIKVFKQWIYKEISTPLPLFLAEPTTNSIPSSNSNHLMINAPLSNDDNVCAGYMSMMNVFIMSSSNLLLLEVPTDLPQMLEKQVDVSKRVFNIYRYMVMKIEMDREVWENLVQVLIRVTECIIAPQVPEKREDSLGGRLAPPLFQTLVVTWIKANLNIQVSNQLWEKFHHLVSSLTAWEELISEWSSTMFILNRVMSRYVFHINLNELPVDKTLADRKRELRNKPRLHHIRSVSNTTQQHQNQSNQQHQLNQQSQDVQSISQQTIRNQHHQQQQHDQISRTSSHTDDSAKISVQRLVSNESMSNNVNGNISYYCNHRRNNSKISTPLLHSVSINRHREYHKNQLINRLLKRSLSDSCLVLTVQQSLCPIRTSIQSKIIKRSYKSAAAIRRNSKKNRQKLTIFRNNNNNNNLPMIDDEEIDDELTMGIGESFDYQHDYYIENGYHDAVHDDLDENVSMNENYLIDYLKRKTLYRSNSMNDLSLMYSSSSYQNIVNHRNNLNHDHSNQPNGSDSMADTLSLGASFTGAVGECNSLKETPLTFDSTSAASTCSSSIIDQQVSFGSSESGAVSNKHHDAGSLAARPVLLGGQLRGWNAEAAAILWRRMLEILGDPNDIKDPKLHRMAFECLAKITEDFTKIRDNIAYLNATSGIENVNGPLLVPSLHYYTSWLFKATTLPHEYKSGRLLAYKLLCMIAMYRSEQELTKEFLVLFYLALKRAILSDEMELINIIIKYCGPKFFSASLWGSSCLLFHFVSAANIIIGSTEIKTYPRIESLQLLGSLIGFFDVFSNVLVLRSTDTLSPETYTKLKDHVIEIIISASKREQHGLGRVISFCSLGIFLYREFNKGSEFNRIKDIINILVAGTRMSVRRTKPATSPSRSMSPINVDATNNNNYHNNTNINYAADNSKFNNRVICRVACDMLRLLADHSQYLINKHPDLARRIIEGLCYTFELHIDIIKQKTLLKDFKNLLLCIMFCLSHWCMAVNKDFLLNTMVSDDYPSKILQYECKKYEFEDGSEIKNQIRPCLLDLILSLYISVVNLDPVTIVKNQSLNSPASEALKNSPQIGDLETMDYTIINGSTSSQYSDDMLSSISDNRSSASFDQQIENAASLKKAAHLILLYFMNFLGHFPATKMQSASISAQINENDDNPYVADHDRVDYESLNAPNVLVFTINDTCLMSFIELPLETFDSSIWTKILSSSAADALPAKPIRIIIRNVLGKFAWDSIMLSSQLVLDNNNSIGKPLNSLANDQSNNSNSPDSENDEEKNEMNSYKNSLVKDNLEILVNSIYETTPECRQKMTSTSNDDFLHSLNQMPEAVDTLALLINQHFQESQFIEDAEFNNNHQLKSNIDRITPDILTIDNNTSSYNSSIDSSDSDLLDPVKAFQYCRQMIEQLGFLSWEKRKQIELLSKTQSTVRELRHLDNQHFREQHKIAVIYVGHSQETRESILLNKCGSRAFEEFVSRLGWEVNLATHAGFMGGLQSNLSTGITAPYYADSFNEVIFHVSTRLEPFVSNDLTNANTINTSLQQPIDKQQLMNMKMRHLGNDEVHIIWSEHYKEYRRSILATEFGDVLIVIYPLPAHTYPNLFRIQIMRKPEVPFFGPLFHGAVVHRDELAGLVRATAINASRGKRLNMNDYKPYFETRYDTIKNLITKFKDPTIFEEFANRIYAPRYDLLQSKEFYATSNLAKLMESGFITIEDFIQCTSHSNHSFASLPSTPHSLNNEPISPASSTVSSEISFSNQHHHQPQQQQQPSPVSPQSITSMQSPSIVDSSAMTTTTTTPFKMVSVLPLSTTATSGTSLRGLRPNSRNSFNK